MRLERFYLLARLWSSRRAVGLIPNGSFVESTSLKACGCSTTGVSSNAILASAGTRSKGVHRYDLVNIFEVTRRTLSLATTSELMPHQRGPWPLSALPALGQQAGTS
jgi:hypothetical protein